MFAMLQTPLIDGVSFDPFSFFYDTLSASKVGISWCDVLKALVISAVVVMIDEATDLPLEITG